MSEETKVEEAEFEMVEEQPSEKVVEKAPLQEGVVSHSGRFYPKELWDEVVKEEVTEMKDSEEEGQNLTPEQQSFQQQMMKDIQEGKTTTIPEGMDIGMLTGDTSQSPQMKAVVAKMKQREAIKKVEKKNKQNKAAKRNKMAKKSRKQNRRK